MYLAKKWVSALTALVLVQAAAADDRVRVLAYEKDAVTRVAVATDRTTMLVFPANEPIADAVMSEADAFKVELTADGRRLAIKALRSAATTNLVVITDARSYLFDLEASRDADYLVRFEFPEAEGLKKRERLSSAAGRVGLLEEEGDEGLAAMVGELNFEYTWAGEEALAPVRVFDDGTFTYFRFDVNDSRPAIYSVGADGFEELLNFHVEDKYIAVHGIGAQFALRYGSKMLCVFNEEFSDERLIASIPR